MVMAMPKLVGRVGQITVETLANPGDTTNGALRPQPSDEARRYL
jgi:hypothetical protein